MSTEKEKAFEKLEEVLRPKLEELRQVTHRKIKLVKELSQLIDETQIMPPEWISSFLKWLFEREGIDVSDDTIERACGPLHTQKTKPRKDPQIREVDAKKEIEVSSSGSESYTKPDGTEGERETDRNLVAEAKRQVINVAFEMQNEEIKELEIRLDEALTLADDKDKRIYQLEMKQGELELQIDELTKKPVVRKESDVDKIEELTIENDNLKLRMHEIEEALRANVKASGFTQASHLPKHAWIAAIDAMSFYLALQKARDYAINNNDPWHKILFDTAEDGKLGNARLEGDGAR